MEPRPFRRGNIAVALYRAVYKGLLQWSHVLSDVETTTYATSYVRRARSFNGATSFQTWKQLPRSGTASTSTPLLQWSHVLSDVETRPTRSS